MPQPAALSDVENRGHPLNQQPHLMCLCQLMVMEDATASSSNYPISYKFLYNAVENGDIVVHTLEWRKGYQ